MRPKIPTVVLFGAVTLGLQGSTVMPTGLYKLNNHPDGRAATPFYGLRLDELFNLNTSGHEIYTFDFNHAQSNMHMTYDGSTIHIFGDAYGGRDGGTSYDAKTGVYAIDFTYNMRVGPVAGDTGGFQDIIAGNYGSGDARNKGTVTGPDGEQVFYFVEEQGNFAFSFRFGDENSGLGHRGFSGLSGWGWLTGCTTSDCSQIGSHIKANDWLFTATHVPVSDPPVPEPGTYVLIGAGLTALGFWRRGRSA